MEALDKLELFVEHSEDEDREPIEFDVRTKHTDERVATVWGNEPSYDVQIDCDHPDEWVEFPNDNEEQGECLICGAKCDWEWQKEWLDQGHDEDGKCIGREVEVRKIIDWYNPKTIGGAVGEYLKELQKRF